MEAVDTRHFLLMPLSIVGFQEYSAEGWRQRQGVQCRDDNADSHGHTELTIERTASATDKRYWHEHGSHHQRNGDDSTRNLVHGIDRGRQRRLVALVQLGVNSLHHHNGIVHHNGNSQQQGR